MKIKHLIACLLPSTSLIAIAQGPPQGPPPDPVSLAIDKNEDGKLSAFEIRGALKSLLKLDKNKDNSLSAEELRPEEPRKKRRPRSNNDAENRPPRPPASSLMLAIDTNKDGELSKEELTNAPDSLRKLDEDGNGRLSIEESGLKQQGQGAGRGAQPQGGGQGGGPNGPPPNGPGQPPRR